MSETTEEYKQRLAGYLDGKEPLSIQGKTPGELGRMIAEASPEQLTRRPEKRKWSVLEILVHLAEDELATSWRYRQIMEQEGVSLNGFDQDLWARLGNYGKWSAGDALELFRLLREANLRLLSDLSPDDWQRWGEHKERGRLTIADLARHMAGHDMNHIKQIERLLEPASPATHQESSVNPEFGKQECLEVQQISPMLQTTPTVLRDMISPLPDRVVSLHPGAGKWCIKEVIGHLAEEDGRDFVGRINAMLLEYEPPLAVNDQDRLARERRDCGKDIDSLLDEFAMVRSRSIAFLKQLETAQLERRGFHPRIGPIRVRELLHEWIYHDLNHIRQIQGNIQSSLWPHLGNMRRFYTD
jgi:uncharacterized damage-inducible protein DinB